MVQKKAAHAQTSSELELKLKIKSDPQMFLLVYMKIYLNSMSKNKLSKNKGMANYRLTTSKIIL